MSIYQLRTLQMREQNLKGYFESNLTAEQLLLDLRDSQQKTSYDVVSVFAEQIDDGEFEIKTEHLIKLCDDVISTKFSSADLNIIAFVLITSDYFYWNDATQEGVRIADVIFDWDNPEIGYDLTKGNIQHWREYLLTGKNNFDTKELKKKFRDDERKHEQ